MGREIKRVALDFDWPLEKVWEGFINPHWQHRRECEMCQGSGYSPETKKLSDQWYGYVDFEPAMTGNELLTIETPEVYAFAKRNVERDKAFYTRNGVWSVGGAIRQEAKRLCELWNNEWCHHLDQDDVQALLDAGRLIDFTHVFTPGEGWKRREDNYTPTAKEVNLWSLAGFGHDSINQWVCVKAKAERLGYEVECHHCGGSGNQWRTEQDKINYDSWKEQEPPAGEGWQVWETVTEVSPVSPVFSTAEKLENWLIAEGYSEGAAEKFVQSGWVPSFVGIGNRLVKDIEAANVA